MARRRKRKAAGKGYPDLATMLTKPSKKKLSQEQEFQIMKMVLDKFLWLGFIIMAFGLYMMLVFPEDIYKGFSFIIVGAIVLILLTILIVREYEIMK